MALDIKTRENEEVRNSLRVAFQEEKYTATT